MNLKVRKKLLTLVATGITISMCQGCSYEEEMPEKPVIVETIPIETEEIIEEPKEIVETTETMESAIEEIEEAIDASEEIIESIEPVETTDIITVKKVKATQSADVRLSPSEDGEIIKTLYKTNTLPYIDEDDNWYKVMYDYEEAYISKDVSEVIETQEFVYDYIKTIYLTKACEMYEDESLENEITDLNKFEFLEVYDELENSYLVKQDNNIGYIYKDNAEEISGKFVVVDISDQIVNLYNDGKITLSSPVVTGRAKKSPTTKGIFSIFEKSHDRYLVGPGYKSYVNVMMKFHNGEGLHDAEYHTDDNGKKHGWRDISEFGGDTYLTNGSHGCVNMPNQAAKDLYNEVEIGTKVLVKE